MADEKPLSNVRPILADDADAIVGAFEDLIKETKAGNVTSLVCIVQRPAPNRNHRYCTWIYGPAIESVSVLGYLSLLRSALEKAIDGSEP